MIISVFCILTLLHKNKCSPSFHKGYTVDLFMEFLKLYETWVSTGCNYTSGRLLYQNYGKSRFVKTVLAKGETKSNVALLAKELRAMVAEDAPITAVQPVRIEKKKVVEPKEQYDVLSLPPSMQEKHYLKGKYHKEAGSLRAQLRYEPNQDKRRDIIAAMMQLLQKRDGLWRDINFFLAHGVDRKKPKDMSIDIETLSTAELSRIEKRLAPSLTRMKKKMDLLTGPDLEHMMAQYNEGRERLQKIRELLRA